MLLVEDNAGDAGLVQEALAEHQVDCALDVVTDGEHAILLLADIDAGAADCPDLIILDLNLPKRSGTDVLRFIRASVKCAQVPVLVLSSSGAARDRQQAVNLGATRYVQKPTLLDEFIALGAVFKSML